LDSFIIPSTVPRRNLSKYNEDYRDTEGYRLPTFYETYVLQEAALTSSDFKRSRNDNNHPIGAVGQSNPFIVPETGAEIFDILDSVSEIQWDYRSEHDRRYGGFCQRFERVVSVGKGYYPERSGLGINEGDHTAGFRVVRSVRK